MAIHISLKFYDTNALLLLLDEAFKEKFVCSDITLFEIEHIKTSANKDPDVKFKARKLTHLLDENKDMYSVIVWEETFDDGKYGISNDLKIVECANSISSNDLIFISNDICCKNIARIFGLNVQSVNNKLEESYSGYIEITLSEEDMAYFYNNLTKNIYDLLCNQYLILKDESGNVIDKFRWDGHEYQNVKISNLKSEFFGTIKPYNGDVYQHCALNSFQTNQVTMIKGHAGTGKSYLSLGYLFYLLDRRKIDKIIVFCNTVATVGSAKLGYYPGSKDEKLIDSSIGNMLGAKIGGTYGVELLIQQNKLQLLPMSDIRGFDTSGMNAGIYITEAQNMDISLMKLALQRIGSDCICIIDGDFTTQVDMKQYDGNNNGMRRLSEVFRGSNIYGEVELKNIYRSKIALLANLM